MTLIEGHCSYYLSIMAQRDVAAAK